MHKLLGEYSMDELNIAENKMQENLSKSMHIYEHLRKSKKSKKIKSKKIKENRRTSMNIKETSKNNPKYILVYP